MSTATLLPTSVHDADVAAATLPARHGRPAGTGGSAAVRAFLAHYSGTLLPLLAAVTGLEVGWQMYAADTGPAAAAVVTGWALVTAAWLHRRGWQPGTVRAVIAAPAAVLAGLGALGWLAPAGLVVWGPVATVLAAAPAMAAQPPAPERPALRRASARD
ncbi:hypothetical protein [Geodermatophilus obscurus]|uniref:Uncharacterized protein n=1 Tax=Geodermatophilus obscurus (strain ATCC 25078 / DSM 43160 / JCM 3152 / CCUG 61914 / KCC A-0152 / KCTC 9177 / NBRC 13315 / NRRL B-3577 / G-20) TaxID=526225 RepID=D2SDB6_GEOOG|nr:hypothetical protein [Geodermatophilus obscurus]ADB76465.1 conserved hypothetical protein [Geodermatophilus obscurus DSM 43160]